MDAVTVIVPLYNKAATVGRAIDSILAQTAADFTIVVVDDGSTDGGVDAVRQVRDRRIRLIRQPNAGPGAARNAGAALANTPLLAFLDADDEWTPQFLQYAVAALREHGECAAFVAAYDTGEYQHLQTDKLQRLGLAEGPWKLDARTPAATIKQYVDACHSSCTVVRREAFDAFGGFYDFDHCVYGEDSYLWLQLVLNRSIFYCPKQLVNFHVEDSTLGVKMTGQHPIRPALTDPVKLRQNCTGAAAEVLTRLLAYYRFIETEGLSRQGALAEIRRLRRLYPYSVKARAGVEKRMFWQERKLEIRALLSKVRHWTRPERSLPRELV